jgi:hypothetical protein
MRLTRFVSTTVLLLILSTVSRADVTASVSYGWSSTYRPGHWTPVFVTVSSDKPRQVLIDLYAPHDRSFGVTPHILATAGPRPATYPMFVPLNLMARDATVTIRDPQSHRKLADAPFVPDSNPNRYAMDFENTATGDMLFVGVGGTHSIPALKHVHAANHDAVVGFLAVEDLPATAIGYDGLDVLALPNPNFANLSLDQQTAMVDWVRAGGRLIVLPGEATVPAGSLLESILPAGLGDVTVLDIPAKQLASLSLPSRFAHLQSRELKPTNDAKELKLANIPRSAYHQRVGFGQTMLLPFDASQLPLDPDPAKRFWQPIIQSIHPLVEQANQQNALYEVGVADSRRNLVINPLMELLGDVPGVGRFDFSYVAYSLIGLMLLVGPVDWFVLKRIGRQPWTWLTTTGWVALLTIVAIFLGQSLRSGDLHFRTIDVIDEADNAAVARTTMAALYSPHTDNYAISADADSWWQPLAPSNEGYYYGAQNNARNDLSFTQTYRGNLPDPMRVNIWNLRFIEAGEFGAAPARIAAALIIKNNHIVGTITNRSDAEISHVTIRTSRGTADIPGSIAPGKTSVIDQAIDSNGNRRFQFNTEQGYPYRLQNSGKPTLEEVTLLAGNLAGGRSVDIDKFVSDGGYACIYCLAQPPTVSTTLFPTPKIENHYVITRSLIPLTKP